MPLGIAGKRNASDAVPLDNAAREQSEAVVERPDRRLGIAADQQDGRDTRLAGYAAQKIIGLSKAGEAARRDMRHRLKPGLPKPRAGSDDVVMRDAAGVVDEDFRAGGEEIAQTPPGRFVARRQLDR